MKATPKTQPRRKATADKASKKVVSAKTKATPKNAATNAEAVTKMAGDLETACEAVFDRVGLLRKGLQALSVPQLCTYWEQFYGFQPVAEWLASEEDIHCMIDEHIEELQEAGDVEEDDEEEDDDINEDIEMALKSVQRIKGEEASNPA